MPASKSERLINLVILLLVSNNYVTKDRIRALSESYRACPTDEAFEKMFERDKEELRSLGIPIEVGYLDKFFEDEQGYRITRDAFELPELDFTPDEVAVLGLAARVWQHAGLASATSDALVKLAAAGMQVDREAIDAVRPTLVAEEPAFDAMWQATLSHTPVAFDYKRPGDTDPMRRHLQPWGVVTAHERWYVVGFDSDREQPRMFRLSRVQGEVALGRPESFTVPDGVDLRELSATLQPARAQRHATVLARSGTAHGLRQVSTLVASGVEGPDGTTAWDRLDVGFGWPDDLVEDLLGYADVVYVEQPDDVREGVLARLRALAPGQASA